MKIKSFNPFILSSNSEEVIRTFEELGFVKNHANIDVNSGKNPTTCMKNADGFKVDIAQSDNIIKDLQAIRINVEDFDAAYQEFLAMGFVNIRGDNVVHTSSSDSCMLVSPTGFTIVMSKHIK